MARISKRLVDAAQPSAKPFFVWDDRLSGFGLLVLPTGAKSFVFQYRTPEGRTRRATIGKAGALMPDQARKLAEGMARKVKDGGDPLQDKADARNALTVNALLDFYTASPRYAKKAKRTQATHKGQIDRHLKPLLGRRHVAHLTQDDILQAFAAIRDGKTQARIKTRPRGLARVTGGEGAARYACRLLRAAFSWAVTERKIERNPTTGIDFGTDSEREAVLDAPDYARLFATLATMETEQRLRPAVADAVRIIAMTGCRRGEATGLRWSHIDLKTGRIVLPVPAHKTGKKTGKPRTIHLPAAAQQIIARQPEGAPDDLVFQPSKGAGPVSLAKPWRAIRTEAGLPKSIGLHGLRHSLATMLAVGGAQAPEIMTSLGHRQLSTTTRYLHFADTARAALAERAAAPALAAMAAASGAQPATIATLPRGRR
jgi:integrase